MWFQTSVRNALNMINLSKGNLRLLQSLMALLSIKAMVLEAFKELEPKTLSVLAKDLIVSLTSISSMLTVVPIWMSISSAGS